jgi:Neuraminidase (sialidase)
LGAPPGAPDKIEQLKTAVAEAIRLEQHIAQLEEDAKVFRKQQHYLRSQVIPDIMAELQMSELVSAGHKIKVEDFYSGSLPKESEKRQAALDWLKTHGGEALIKTELTVPFAKSQHNVAIALTEDLAKQGYNVSLDSTVHSQTLLAFVREKVRNGDDIDFDTLGIYSGKVAKITEVKK